MRENQKNLAEWMTSQAGAFAKYQEAKGEYDQMDSNTPEKFKKIYQQLVDQAMERVDEVSKSILETLVRIRSLIKDVYDLA